MSDLIEYIKIQWADIHHSRNQEWKILAIIGGSFYILLQTTNIILQMVAMILGLVACLLGIYISIMHWAIFYSKVRIIDACEKELGIEATFYKSPFPIQGIITLFYFLFSGVLAGWLAWLLSNRFWISLISSMSIFIIGLVTCIVSNLRIRKIAQQQISVTFRKEDKEAENNCNIWMPNTPLVAELNGLVDCLKLLGQRPLKLLANKFHENESMWNTSEWSFVASEGKVIDKKLLLNPKDTFQFSIADERSKQDFHMHKKTFEIFVSYSKMEVVYSVEGEKKTAQVSKGILIMPPNLPHRVRLYGPSFVFQATIGGEKIHNDKEITSLPAAQEA